MNFVVAESLMFSSILDVRYVWGADEERSDIVLTRSCIFIHPERGMYKLIPITDQNAVFLRASSLTQYEFRTMPWGETVSMLFTVTRVVFGFPDDHEGHPREACVTKIDGEKYVLRLQRWSRRMLFRLRWFLRRRTCALWMSQHPRLGADSLLRHVDKEILWKIHALC